MKPVAIVGGGITGLTAAHYLDKASIPFTLYEANAHVGGLIQTTERDGYIVEHGPNTILETSPIIGRLIAELGIEGRRIRPNPQAKRRYIVRDGVPVPLPTSLGSALTTPLFSMGGKLRVLAEPFIRRGRHSDESLAHFVQRRLGDEVLDYAVDPFVAGVYAGSPEVLSARYAFGKLWALEQDYGSLLAGTFLGARKRRKRGDVSKASAPPFSFDRGMQVLTGALESRLGGNLRLLSPIDGMRATVDGWRLSAPGGLTGEHSAVLLCAPAHQLCKFDFPGGNLSPFTRIPYPSVTRIAFGFRREQIQHPLDGFGVLVPRKERLHILGALFSSTIFSSRAPQGHVLITVFIGGSRTAEAAHLADNELVRVALTDLRQLLGAYGAPGFVDLRRIARAIPQYTVGYGETKAWMDKIEATQPGVFLAGNFRDGIAAGDSIVSGYRAAARIVSYLHHDQTGHFADQSRVA